MNSKLLVKIIVLILMCLFSSPIAEFVAQNFGSITTDAYTISRISEYAASIRMICLILLVYFIFTERRNDL